MAISNNSLFISMDYEVDKLNKEYQQLQTLWNKLKAEWIQLSDPEDLYRIYPLLTTTAAIARKYITWNKALNCDVKVIKPSLERKIDTSEYLFSDNKDFFNGVKESKPLSVVAGHILHRTEYVYMDDRRNNIDLQDKITIYIFMRSDQLCKSCSLANNGVYDKKGKNYKKAECSVVSYSDCTCGYYIDVDSYLSAGKKVIGNKLSV